MGDGAEGVSTGGSVRINCCAVTSCLYPSYDPIHFLLGSCERHDIRLLAHGVGETFAGWDRMWMQHAIPHLKLLSREYSHVLYMDGVDSLVLGGLGEIVAKYTHAGFPPCMMSADTDIPTENTAAFAQESWACPYWFLNAGQFIGEIRFMIETFERLSQIHEGEGDSQKWFIRSWPVDGIYLDSRCSIFQVMDGNTALIPMQSRVFNAITGTFPSVLHFRGGYCDPATGRAERIIPWITKLNLMR